MTYLDPTAWDGKHPHSLDTTVFYAVILLDQPSFSPTTRIESAGCSNRSRDADASSAVTSCQHSATSRFLVRGLQTRFDTGIDQLP